MALVTRIVQKQIHNGTKIVQVHFDASGTAHTLKPGETRMISAITREEVAKVDNSEKKIAGLQDRIKELESELAKKTVVVAPGLQPQKKGKK
jgi:hypothetical protein